MIIIDINFIFSLIQNLDEKRIILTFFLQLIMFAHLFVYIIIKNILLKTRHQRLQGRTSDGRRGWRLLALNPGHRTKINRKRRSTRRRRSRRRRRRGTRRLRNPGHRTIINRKRMRTMGRAILQSDT